MKKNVFLILIFISYVNVFCYKSVYFLSTQLNPVEETNSMREIILKDFNNIEVTFNPCNNKEMASIIKDHNFIDLIGGTYGDFESLKKEKLINDVDSILINMDHTIIKNFTKISKLGSNKHYFIPWMQATYLMVANKKALKYLPEGSDINNLTYSELTQWGKNIYEKTKSNKIGFPIGKNGLWHRFLEGYLYPSYTGSMYENLNSKKIYLMWSEFGELWNYVKRDSLTYNRMDIPLYNEEIWIAWDHTARLSGIFKKKPDDFIAFPAPIGPAGRGYMLVLAGLSVPKDKKIRQETKDLIQYLLEDNTQILTTNTVGFFPVTEIKNIKKLDIEQLYKAILEQEKSSQSISILLPSNLGKNAPAFDSSYKKAFSKIILRNKNITTIMNEQKFTINELLH